MEGSSRESLSNEVVSSDASETLISTNFDEGENLNCRPVPHSVLIEAEITVAYQRKEHVDRFVKTYRGVTGQ